MKSPFRMWIFQPASVVQSQAMSTLRRAQRPSQLLALLEDMPQQQVTPNEISVAAEPGKNLENNLWKDGFND